jgi:filamentous hemagglutinin
VMGRPGGTPPGASPGLVLVESGVGVVPKTPAEALGNAILNSGNDDRPFGGKSINELSDAGKVPDPSDKSGELTGAGRALQKHGGRDGSAFPSAKGNPTAINEQGQKIVDDILNDPGSTVIQRNTGRFGDVIDVTAPDGRGLRYSVDGKFITFLEPKAK